jgi:hypothetical protein
VSTARRFALALALVALLAAAALGPRGAPAQDSEAPPGASPRWLPCERWVMEHWLPFDELRLARLLDVSSETLRAWLRDDRRHTLAQLVERRGETVEGFADRLLAPRRPGLSEARYATFHRRAVRVLTQGHLAQHILYHPMHQPAIALDARRIFGVRAVEYRRLRLTGWSPARIGRANGRSRRQVLRATERVLRRSARLGIARGEMPRAQAWRYFRLQRGVLAHWVATPIRKPGARRTGRTYRAGTLRPRSRLACFLFAGRVPGEQPGQPGGADEPAHGGHRHAG